MTVHMRLARVLPAAAVVGVFVALRLAERRWPLREQRRPERRRVGRNLAVGALTGLTVQATEKPAVVPLARWVERRGFGLAKLVRLPAWLESAVCLLLLDYTLYVNHVLTHRVEFLWRFHEPHHVDLDLDVSTGIRFHFVELLLSVPWRAAQVLVIGVSPRNLELWQKVALAAILFHHSNLRLPPRLERALSRVLVTPHMHGIHHSIVREETDSNWSSGLSIWDRLHGTFRSGVPSEAIDIGVPAYRDPDRLRLRDVFALPFRPRPNDAWRLPDGTRARRGAGGDLVVR